MTYKRLLHPLHCVFFFFFFEFFQMTQFDELRFAHEAETRASVRRGETEPNHAKRKGSQHTTRSCQCGEADFAFAINECNATPNTAP